MTNSERTPTLLDEILRFQALIRPDREALVTPTSRTTYGELEQEVEEAAGGLLQLGVRPGDRLAIFLPKTAACVAAIFTAARIGAIAVPINPALKRDQALHIIRDSGAQILITDPHRHSAMGPETISEEGIEHVILTNGPDVKYEPSTLMSWSAVRRTGGAGRTGGLATCPTDPAMILYTSGSTGRPKGVLLSHRNLALGAQSVALYLDNRSSDRILAALPLSFDAGFSQVTTAFSVGASVILHEHVFPADTVRVCENEKVTGITGIPTLWNQLADQSWPDSTRTRIRYFANTGGKLPQLLLAKLRELFPNSEPYLMYGFTEAFRSTYLPPSEVQHRPNSIGKAIPNANVFVINDSGGVCGPNEPGELVHTGPLVALGYWNRPIATSRRFRPAPFPNSTRPEIRESAAWSGDIVVADEAGYLYFVGRRDEMIKTSGYRVSPTEVEEIAIAAEFVREAAAFGIDHEYLGQEIAVLVAPQSRADQTEQLIEHFRRHSPEYLIPKRVFWSNEIPKTPNGKVDRLRVAEFATRLEKSAKHQ